MLHIRLKNAMVIVLAVAGMAFLSPVETSAAQARPNILLITADDMNGDTPGCFGNPTPEITPNIDRLAADGMRFRHAHVTIAVCTPCRSVLLTGLYPHHSGVEGFQRIKPGTPTLPAVLGEAGYFCGMIGKPLGQQETFRWAWEYQYKGRGNENGSGRDPAVYYRFCKEFLDQAKDQGKPFFLMANSHDPHRAWHGSEEDAKLTRTIPEREVAVPSRVYQSSEIKVPGFLPDLPDIRKEIAQYYSSARRCDDTVGMVLKALRETGQEDNTLVMFLSDNGMSCPFAKTNCYLQSTRTPWIVRWPGRVQPGSVDNEHFISAIDFMPTILAAAGVTLSRPVDGFSFIPVLEGGKQAGRDRVFTQFNHIHGKRPYPMRCVQNKRFGYIFNPWSNGTRTYFAEPMDGLTYPAMEEAAKTDPAIAKRVRLYLHRVVEEFYDFEKDPNALHNLIDDPAYAGPIAELKAQLLDTMKRTADPALEAFQHADSPDELERFMKDYTTRAAREIKELRAYEIRTGYAF